MVKAPLFVRRYVLKCCWRTTSLSYISATNILNMLKFLFCSVMITAVIALFFFLSLQGGLWKIIIHVSLISTFFSTIPSYKSEPYLHFLIPVFSFQSYSDRKPVQSRLQKVSLQQKVCFHLIYIFKQKVLTSKLVINEGTSTIPKNK